MSQSFLLGAIVAAVAWGALAFGAVYPWAYVPLGIFCALVGIAGLVSGGARRPPLVRLALALTAIGVAVSLQLVPLPRTLLARVSPGTDAFLRQYDLSYSRPTEFSDHAPDEVPEAAYVPPRPISIRPDKTALGLTLFVALALFLLGAARVVSMVGARTLALAVMALGILLTVLAVVQIALNPDPRQLTLIYGFWKPQGISSPFGPFVNPNHYAGWMLMALPLVLGLACGTLEQALHAGAPNGRGFLTVVSQGGELALSLFAALIMGVSLMMTKSRSGIACFVVALVLTGAMVLRRQQRANAKGLVVAALTVLFLGVVTWAGVDNVLTKFREPDRGLVSATGRLSAWKDAVSIVRDSPLTGMGFDTYGTAMVLYQSSPRDSHFQETHNDYLQLAAEGGALVCVPVFIALLLFVSDVRHRFREAPREGMTYWLRVGAVIGLIAIALQSLVEFSLQMPGNAALFVVLSAIALHRSPHLMARPARTARSLALVPSVD